VLSVLREDGTLMAMSKNDGIRMAPDENAAERSRNYVRRHWRYKEPGPSSAGNCCGTQFARDTLPPVPFFDRILSHSLCISGMAFQDAWNIDLERLQKCCVHVATAQNRLVPFCAYYMTDSSGRRLYGKRESKLALQR
jgi:hypothetical protein